MTLQDTSSETRRSFFTRRHGETVLDEDMNDALDNACVHHSSVFFHPSVLDCVSHIDCIPDKTSTLDDDRKKEARNTCQRSAP